MIKLSKYLSILAVSTSCVVAEDDNDAFIKGLHTTSVNQQVQAKAGTSTVFSPLGANIVVQSMASVVDPSETALRKEIATHTNAESNPASLGVFTGDLASGMQIETIVYTEQSITPNPEGMDELAKTGATHIPISFKDPQGAADTINAKVNKATKGRIKELLTENSIQSDTVLGLLNLMLVQELWSDEFWESSMPFHAGTSPSSEVKCLVGNSWTKSLETDSATLTHLNTKERKFSLVLKMPKGTSDVTPITEQDVADLKTKGKEEMIQLKVPHVQMETTLNLKDSMKGTLPKLLGGTPFETMLLEDPISVGSFLQKCIVKWNHKGLEAAAATLMFFSKGLSIPTKTIAFDHPFSYMLVYNTKGTQIPVFAGQVFLDALISAPAKAEDNISEHNSGSDNDGDLDYSRTNYDYDLGSEHDSGDDVDETPLGSFGNNYSDHDSGDDVDDNHSGTNYDIHSNHDSGDDLDALEDQFHMIDNRSSDHDSGDEQKMK